MVSFEFAEFLDESRTDSVELSFQVGGFRNFEESVDFLILLRVAVEILLNDISESFHIFDFIQSHLFEIKHVSEF